MTAVDEVIKIPISVCILVKNEEHNLLRSLPPLGVFEEILVYDSGSSDRSISISKSYGAKVIQGAWYGFAKTRRKLFSLASQPWIFWLDADEVMSPDLSLELQTVFSNKIQCQGFEINRMVSFYNQWIRHGEWFPDWKLRIFRADCWTMEDRDIHEAILLDGTVDRMDGLLEHYSYKDWDDRSQRIEKYSTLWAEMKWKNGDRSIKGSGPIIAFWRFFRAYFLKLGILDGLLGFRIAVSIAREVSLKYKKLSRLSSE